MEEPPELILIAAHPIRQFRRKNIKKMEAEPGIEPRYTDLQSAA